MSSSVFVYGTLKPGERNHNIAKRGGTFISEEGSIQGFEIYQLLPENYPGVTLGNGIVHGWLLTYEDIEYALQVLDELEGVHESPPLYERILVTVFPQKKKAWVYTYCNTERCKLQSAELITSGVWRPTTSEIGLYP